ncbi:hypothetical protein HG530_013361 [Fusarium avenaceum]|nr:hypothetical protein HG530_013361 [Fusarium avenaceum]
MGFAPRTTASEIPNNWHEAPKDDSPKGYTSSEARIDQAKNKTPRLLTRQFQSNNDGERQDSCSTCACDDSSSDKCSERSRHSANQSARSNESRNGDDERSGWEDGS